MFLGPYRKGDLLPTKRVIEGTKNDHMGQPNDARFAALCMELAQLIQEAAIMERDLDWLLHRCQEVEADAKKAETRYQEAATVEQKSMF